MARVCRDVNAEVARLGVQLLRIRGDVRVLRVRWHGVAVAEAKRHVLRARNDVHGPRELVRGAHDRRLRKEHALRHRLLRRARQVERGGRIVGVVEEIELARLRLEGHINKKGVAGTCERTYEACDEVRIRELASEESVREHVSGDRVHPAREEVALSSAERGMSVSRMRVQRTYPLAENPWRSAASKAFGACAVIA